ncbi:radical SAM protein, partial [Vicingaceae bacterium]|nr:radical SAM protein [Vicingaceae bacterium]
MVEEIKQTFRGQIKGSFKSIFAGIVVSKGDNELVVRGNYPLDLESYNVKIGISESSEISLEKGLTMVKNSNHIRVGDIISVNGNSIRSLFRPYSPHNSIFATVRCNSNCLMCSQPPLDYDDTKEYYYMWKYAISLMPDDVRFIGITGGEPMLMGDYLVGLINDLTDKFPKIKIDILSNGRTQSKSITKELLAKIKSPSSVIFAIPLYSDFYQEHDHIVQAKDAFYQTILGIHNLASLGFKIEIRIVLHLLSLKRLDKLADFIHLNFPFVYHITFMGLEIVGH